MLRGRCIVSSKIMPASQMICRFPRLAGVAWKESRSAALMTAARFSDSTPSLLLVQHQQRRSQSTAQSSKGPQPRRRFYKYVGVQPVDAPWEAAAKQQQQQQPKKDESIASPISAGVDGTQSASGVLLADPTETPIEKEARLKAMLTPKDCRSGLPTNAPSETSNNNQLQWYGVTLDGRTLRTPMGQVLAVPSQLLAWAIAAEWDSQRSQIQPVQMPLMTLTCTALDQTAAHAEHYQKTALQYLPTDTTCYWADPTEDRILHRRQEKAWKELHKFIEDQFDNHKPAMALGPLEGMVLSRKNGPNGTVGLPHPDPLVEACVAWTQNLDAWHLMALNAVAAETKSFLVAFAVLHPHSPFSSAGSSDHTKDNIAKAIEAARVEEEFQIESWGLVEGQHDYDRLNCSVQVRAAKLLTSLIHGASTTPK